MYNYSRVIVIASWALSLVAAFMIGLHWDGSVPVLRVVVIAALLLAFFLLAQAEVRWQKSQKELMDTLDELRSLK